MRLEAKAYAKINLGLLIHEKRKDGYHEIETVFHRIDLFDTIVLEPADRISVLTESPGVPSDESNLCWKAALLINEIAGTNNGVRIGLTKKIPTGAGLGGGSSDAACVLRVLPRLWKLTLSDRKLSDAAVRLGSDVPYFLGSGSAHGTGRGEVLDFFTLDFPYAIVVCFPGIQVPTPWAYRQVRAFTSRERGTLGKRLREAVHDPAALGSILENDFEAPVLGEYPPLKKLKDSLLETGAFCASLSGSGSSVYGLFTSEEAASAAAKTLRTDRVTTFLTRRGFLNPDETIQDVS